MIDFSLPLLRFLTIMTELTLQHDGAKDDKRCAVERHLRATLLLHSVLPADLVSAPIGVYTRHSKNMQTTCRYVNLPLAVSTRRLGLGQLQHAMA